MSFTQLGGLPAARAVAPPPARVNRNRNGTKRGADVIGGNLRPPSCQTSTGRESSAPPARSRLLEAFRGGPDLGVRRRPLGAARIARVLKLHHPARIFGPQRARLVQPAHL